MINKLKNTALLILVIGLFCGCYSFTDASISPEIKTFTVSYFPNKASLVEASLSQTFTDKLRNYIAINGRISDVDEDGHIEISGEITDYAITSEAIQGNDKAAQNRLTIRVNVRFINNINPKENFTQSFSRYSTFDSQLDLSAVEASLIDEITEDLAMDIFNRAFSNW